ncbi:MAG TPA: signal peptidase I [Acidimicrobiales bacterium]|nr:signal peptidase I [Acidimicrobiales bacterium]
MRLHNNAPAVANQSSSEGEHRRPWPRRLLGALTNTALGAVAIGVLVAALGPMAGWWHYEVVESGSMTPALKVGGVALVRSEPVSNVHVGQILAFHPPGMKNYVRIHRVIAVSRRDGQVWIRTKGDANNTADPGPIRLLGKDVYHETAFVPYAGYGAVWLYKHNTRVALTVVLFVLVIGGGLYLIWSGDDEREQVSTKKLGAQAPLPRDEPVVATGPPAGSPTISGAPLTRLPRRLAVHHRAPVPDLSAEKAAEQAANASLLALNNIYNKPTAQPEDTERVLRLEAGTGAGPVTQPGSKSAS